MTEATVEAPTTVAPSADQSTDSVLDVFAGAQHASSRGLGQRLAIVATSLFTLVALLAIVTNEREDTGGSDIALLDPVAPAAPSTSDDSGSVAGDGGGTAGTGGSSPDSGGGSSSGLGGADPTSGDTSSPPFDPAPTPGSSDPGGPVPTTPPVDEETNIGVLTPTLDVFSFGAEVGMPLICNVASSALVSQVPDPAVAEVATTIVTTCLEFGTEGSAALRELNTQLAALEALNPATVPVIDALADIFVTSAEQDVPFADALTALGDLLRYFGGA